MSPAMKRATWCRSTPPARWIASVVSSGDKQSATSPCAFTQRMRPRVNITSLQTGARRDAPAAAGVVRRWAAAARPWKASRRANPIAQSRPVGTAARGGRNAWGARAAHALAARQRQLLGVLEQLVDGEAAHACAKKGETRRARVLSVSARAAGLRGDATRASRQGARLGRLRRRRGRSAWTQRQRRRRKAQRQRLETTPPPRCAPPRHPQCGTRGRPPSRGRPRAAATP